MSCRRVSTTRTAPTSEQLEWAFARHSRSAHYVEPLFRLKPGATIEAANRELRAVTARLATVDAAGVVIINAALARRDGPDVDPIRQRITTPIRAIGPMGCVLMPPRAAFTIVGVVQNVRNASLARPAEPAICFSFRQFPFRGFNLVVRGEAPPASLVAAVRQAVRRLDPNLPVSDGRTLDSLIGSATDRPRALMVLMAVFAALAFGLAALDIYSVLSYVVGQRRRELSVRMALGADPRGVLWLVVRQGLTLTCAGAAVGRAGAFAAGRALSSLLFGVSASDGRAYAAALAVTVAAVAACSIPASRAASMDPLQGLRAE